MFILEALLMLEVCWGAICILHVLGYDLKILKIHSLEEQEGIACSILYKEF